MPKQDFPHVGLLALDLDGTVLDAKYDVQPKTLQTIQAAGERIPVVIVTGRMWQQTQQYAELFGNCAACICGQGALTFSPDGRVRNRRVVLPVAVNGAIEVARQYRWDALFYFDGKPHAEFLAPSSLSCVDVKYEEVLMVDNLKEHSQQSCEKVVFLVPEATESDLVKAQLRETVGSTSRVVSASENLVEIIDPSATKGAALRELCAEQGVSLSHVMAIGDSETDMDMFKVAGIPIAVESAPPEVKAAAIDTCRIPEKNGVAEIIQKYHIVSPGMLS